MREWVIVAVLYLLGMGLFRVLGGFGAASDALRRWGRASSALRREQRSPSSPA